MSINDETLDDLLTNETAISDYQFPLKFEFKIGTLSNDFIVKDNNDKTLVYVRQKMFKLKEAIQVFSDESKKRVLFTINADRVIDFNASYGFKNEAEEFVGHIGRKGMRSLWNAHYEIFDNNKNQEFIINEENPSAKFFDALLGEVPVLGMFTGYMFNPKYLVKRADGSAVVRLKKDPSFFGRKFTLEKIGDIAQEENERIILGLMMMSLLERRRG